MKYEIINRWTGAIIYQDEAESFKALVEAAVMSGASLDRASLDGASLDGASLDGASLVGARLVGARLVGASLVGASLVGARLVGASLVGASLVGARLDGAKGYYGHVYIGPIGSRNGMLQVVRQKDGTDIVGAGCWSGSVKDFKARVKATHKDNRHAKDYMAAINLAVKMLDRRAEDK